MSENGTDNAIVFNRMLKQIEKEQSTEKIKREVSIEFKRSDWLASMLAINSGGGAITGTTTGLTLPLIYDVDDQGTIENESVLLNLGSEVHPHVFKFTATRDINIAFLNKPEGNNKAIFFVVEVHQDSDGGHAITATESQTSFDINQQENAITILAGMCINDVIYLTNYGSRITETITTGGTDDIEDWSRHKAKTTVDFGGNLLRKLSTITFSAGPEIHPKASGLEFRIGSGDTHQFKINGNVELEIGTNIDAKSNRITNLARPINLNDATTKTYVDTGLATKSNTDHTHPATRIEDLASFSTADEVNTALGTTGNNARLYFRGHDITGLAKIVFNDALQSSIDTNRGLNTLVTYRDSSGNTRQGFQSVMNIKSGATSSIDVSKYYSNRSADGLTYSNEQESVVEIKGTKKPLLKLVNTDYYGKSTSIRSNKQNIGSIYFDAKTSDTGSNPIRYNQVTFVELKAQAILSARPLPTWSRTTQYVRGDRVSYNGKYWFLVALANKGDAPSESQRLIWRSGANRNTLNRGSLDIVLRNAQGSNVNDDTFHTIMSIDYDRGVTINDHLILPERDSDNNYNVANIYAGLNIGLGTLGVNCYKELDIHDSIDMHNTKIKNLATPTSNNDAANKKYVDDKVGAGGGGGGDDVHWDMLEETLLPKNALGIDIGSLDKIVNSVYSVYGRFRQLESGYKSDSTHNNIIYINDHLYPTNTNNDQLSLGRSYSASRWNHIYGKNINPEVINFKQISGAGATILGAGTSMMYTKGNNLYFYAHGQSEKQIQFTDGSSSGNGGTGSTPGTTNTAVLRIYYARWSVGPGSSNWRYPTTSALDNALGDDLGQMGIWIDHATGSTSLDNWYFTFCIRGKWVWFIQRMTGGGVPSFVRDNDPSSTPTKKRGTYVSGTSNALSSTSLLPTVAGRPVVYQQDTSDRSDGEIIMTTSTSRSYKRFSAPRVSRNEAVKSGTSSDLLTLPSSHIINVSASVNENPATLDGVSNTNGSIIFNNNSNRLCVKADGKWTWATMSN